MQSRGKNIWSYLEDKVKFKNWSEKRIFNILWKLKLVPKIINKEIKNTILKTIEIIPERVIYKVACLYLTALSNCLPTYSRPLQPNPTNSRSFQPTPGYSNPLQATTTHSRLLQHTQPTLTHSTLFKLTAGHSIYSRLLSKHNHTLFETILVSLTDSRKFLSAVCFFFNSNHWINHLNHYLEKIFNFNIRKFHTLNSINFY